MDPYTNLNNSGPTGLLLGANEVQESRKPRLSKMHMKDNMAVRPAPKSITSQNPARMSTTETWHTAITEPDEC